MRFSLSIPVVGLVLVSISAAVTAPGGGLRDEQFKFLYLPKLGTGNVLVPKEV